MNAENGNERLKLLEFGLNHWNEMRQHSSDFGKPAYIAPEILLGGPVNESSDLYSLGVLIYQLLARKLPFDDEDVDFLIQKHLQGSVNMHPIERVKGGENIAPFIRRLLEKDPARRFASIEEVIQGLCEIQNRDGLNLNVKEKESHFSAAPLVGREKEMQLLQDRARRILEGGRGWTVFISGEAG
jgi:eukaryotic-like serine/threonine-protein kinase